jgi:hypothetical protein
MTKLTGEGVARLKLPAGKTDKIFWDDALPAFGLRVQGGKKSWVIQYRAGDAKQRRLTVATAEQLSVTDARKKAGELLAAVKLGHDPAEAKRERIAKANAPRPVTLGEAAELYLRHARVKLKPRSYIEVERHLRQHWQPLVKSSLTTITRADVAKQLSEIAKSGPFAANRARATLNTLFNWAMSRGLTDASPVMGTKPETREISRDRVLTDEELRLVWENAGDGDYRAIVRLLILTGQRRDEIGAMRWSEVDLDKAVWTIPGERTKNRRAHDVPLSDEAVTILNGVARRDGRELVFGSREGPFSGWKINADVCESDDPAAAWQALMGKDRRGPKPKNEDRDFEIAVSVQRHVQQGKSLRKAYAEIAKVEELSWFRVKASRQLEPGNAFTG